MSSDSCPHTNNNVHQDLIHLDWYCLSLTNHHNLTSKHTHLYNGHHFRTLHSQTFHPWSQEVEQVWPLIRSKISCSQRNVSKPWDTVPDDCWKVQILKFDSVDTRKLQTSEAVFWTKRVFLRVFMLLFNKLNFEGTGGQIKHSEILSEDKEK